MATKVIKEDIRKSSGNLIEKATTLDMRGTDTKSIVINTKERTYTRKGNEWVESFKFFSNKILLFHFIDFFKENNFYIVSKKNIDKINKKFVMITREDYELMLKQAIYKGYQLHGVYRITSNELRTESQTKTESVYITKFKYIPDGNHIKEGLILGKNPYT